MIAPQLKNQESVDNISGTRREHIQQQRNEILVAPQPHQEEMANVSRARKQKWPSNRILEPYLPFSLTNK